MAVKEIMVTSLEPVLQGLSDALGVALVLTSEDGGTITRWQFPGALETVGQEPETVPVKNVSFGETGAGILDCGNGQRRFVVDVTKALDSPCFVESGLLPEFYPWIDAELAAQSLPGLSFGMAQRAEFLLGVFLSTVCEVVYRERCTPDASAIEDLDVENIRRIGFSLRKNRIRADLLPIEAGPFSLESVPSLDTFFAPPTTTREGVDAPYGLRDLTEILRRLTAGAKGSFNLMSLSGDFVVESPMFQDVCGRGVRPFFGTRCFKSDIRSLVEGTLACSARTEIPTALCRHCHAGFTEVFCPIFTDGLVVGLVSGGQLLRKGDSLDSVLGEIAKQDPNLAKDLALPEPVVESSVELTAEIVSGLASLIALLFDRFCFANNTAALRQPLVGLGTDKIDELLTNACVNVKRFLGASECAAFRLVDDGLILVATTSRELMVRNRVGGKGVVVPAREAIGKRFYRRGEGVTGSVLITGYPRYEEDVTKARGWAGKCSEGGEPSQSFVAPIQHEGKCYGVLRAVRPKNFSLIPQEHRDLIAGFARELGIVLRDRETSAAHEHEFRERTEAVQSLLAKAAHEFRAPLHHVLQLTTALRYATSSEVENRHKQIKAEVYRAKEIADNYLLFGIEGREELRFDIQLHNVARMCDECMSRLEHAAAARDMRIVWDPRSSRSLQVRCDLERIEQVFTNLIDNAVKYGFEHTEIVLRGKEKTNTVTVSITDMGLGIPKEFQKQIFEGYQRCVEEESRFKRGTGLGLRIAREIVVRHGGEIFVESEPVWRDPKRLAKREGYTTRFTVSLPKLGPAVEN